MIAEKINKTVPNKPGCYIYYNGNHEVIYVGKAKDLKKRMSSYFNRSQNLKTTRLVQEIADFDYIITRTEKEALLLENNLIKENNPKYNILLKDDKTFPYIVITKEEHPRIIKMRNQKTKGTYYGPFVSAHFASEVINYLNQITELRKCAKLPKEECIYYHLGQCYAPCIKNFSKDEVNSYVRVAREFLNNNMHKLKIYVKNEMQEAINEMNFEIAARDRDFLELLEKNQQEQFVEDASDTNKQAVNYIHDDDWITISILTVQNGKLVNIHRVLIENQSLEEDVTTYYYNYLQEDKYQIQQVVIANQQVQNNLQQLLTIPVAVGESKSDLKLLEIAKDNAYEYFKTKKDEIIKKYFQEKNNGYESLQEITKSKLMKIEMYDISHFGGSHQVGAKVSYVNGQRAPKNYRKYKINTVDYADDYAAMKEVLMRRLTRGKLEDDLPDLIIVDGGKGQVGVANEVLTTLDLESIKLIGLVKDDSHKTRGIVNKRLEERPLDLKSPLYRFLFDIQEEVHRFAINYQRTSESKEMFKSVLDDIKGLGPKRKQKINEKFPTTDQLRKATDKELLDIGISKEIIVEIRKKLK